MDTKQIAGEALEQLVSAAKPVLSSVKGQVTGDYGTTKGSADPMPSSLEALAKQASDDPMQPDDTHTNQQAPQMTQQASVANAQKEQQLKAVRDKLAMEQHRETYYDPTFNRPQQQEEAVTEKLEREDQEEKMKLMEEQKKKPEPIALQRAQNRAEMNRGASG